MDLWLSKTWVINSKVYWTFGSSCLLGTVGTTLDEPFNKNFSTSSNTGAVLSNLEISFPYIEISVQLSYGYHHHLGPIWKENEDAHSAKSTGSKTYALTPNWQDPTQFPLWNSSQALCVSDAWQMSDTMTSDQFYTRQTWPTPSDGYRPHWCQTHFASDPFVQPQLTSSSPPSPSIYFPYPLIMASIAILRGFLFVSVFVAFPDKETGWDPPSSLAEPVIASVVCSSLCDSDLSSKT